MLYCMMQYFHFVSHSRCIAWLPSSEILYLGNNSLTGTIPSQIGLLTDLSKSRETLLQPFCLDPTSLASLTPCLRLPSTARLSLSGNRLTGTIPSEIHLLTKLSEWLVACMKFMCEVFLLCLMRCLLFSILTDGLWLYNNSLTGEFTCPDYITNCHIFCFDPRNTNASCRIL